jgi:hypothetical protein
MLSALLFPAFSDRRPFMLRLQYKLRLNERITAKCSRHPRYNPEIDGRGGII